MGYSVQLTASTGDGPVSCELINATNGDTIIPPAQQLLQVGASTLFAGTQVATLPVDSSLLLQCQSPFAFFPFNYSNTSVYAISFASS